MSRPAATPGPFAAEHIVVKFYDHTAQLNPHNVERSLRTQNRGTWDDLNRRFPGSTISRLWPRCGTASITTWDSPQHAPQPIPRPTSSLSATYVPARRPTHLRCSPSCAAGLPSNTHISPGRRCPQASTPIPAHLGPGRLTLVTTGPNCCEYGSCFISQHQQG